jgi:hypothetical protein
MHDNAQTMNHLNITKLACSGIIEIKQLEPAAAPPCPLEIRPSSVRLDGRHQLPATLASTPYAQQRTQTTTTTT